VLFVAAMLGFANRVLIQHKNQHISNISTRQCRHSSVVRGCYCSYMAVLKIITECELVLDKIML